MRLTISAFSTIVILLSGCAGKSVSAPSPPAKIDTTAAVARADEKVEKVEIVVAEMTPVNLPEKKPVAQTLLVEVRKDLAEAKTGAQSDRKDLDDGAKAYEKLRLKNEELSHDDPVRDYLRWASVLSFTAAVGFAVIFAFVRNKTLLVAAGLALFAGGCFYTIAEYLGPIRIVFGVLLAVVVLCAMAFAGWMIYVYLRARQVTKNVIGGIQDAIDAEELVITSVAAKTIDKGQGPEAKAIVDEVQAERVELEKEERRRKNS